MLIVPVLRIDARAGGKEDSTEIPSELSQVLAFLDKEAAHRAVSTAKPTLTPTPFPPSCVYPLELILSDSANAKSISRLTGNTLLKRGEEAEVEEEKGEVEAETDTSPPIPLPEGAHVVSLITCESISCRHIPL